MKELPEVGSCEHMLTFHLPSKDYPFGFGQSSVFGRVVARFNQTLHVLVSVCGGPVSPSYNPFSH